ncbi:MAG: DUF4395 domain-containing protein [Aquiluna sp.]|nr:DUF4395 domain-containing protein [Aquiluna sp.]
MTTPQMIDPRGPRFGAAITTLLSLIAFYLSLSDSQLAYSTVVAIGVLFLWSVLSPRTHPAGLAFKRFIKPRIAPPKELEDARPPKFAQQVGLTFALFGIVGGLFAPVFVTISAAFILIAAFLNAFFGLCLGCQFYLVLRRVGVFR